MQIVDVAPPTLPTPEVLGHSLVLELSWCIHAASSEYLREMHPVLGRLYDERDDLRQRVLEFWPADVGCTVECEVMALHGGVFDAADFATFREGCEAGLPTVPVEPALASETGEVRAATWERLRQLQDSPELRECFFRLLAEIWAYVSPWWETVGLPAAERAAAAARASLAEGRRWHEIATAECQTYQEQLPDIIETQRAGHRVVIAPCALFGRGLYLDLPGCTVVGTGADDLVHAARAETEQVAVLLRALADPTRLAIFHSLRSGPTTVGDIARSFTLAQPTVSMHVKRLREAGLVSSVRQGNRLEISVNQANSDRLATQLTTLLVT